MSAIIPLKSLMPTADNVLNADLETLAVRLLRHLKSCQGLSPIYQHAGLNRDYFLAIMERRNVGLGPLPSKEPEYGSRQPAVSQAFVEAWDWLVANGLLIRNHQQPAEWYLITRKGEKQLQSPDGEQKNVVKMQPGDGRPKAEKPGERWDVFISHASEDKPYVDPLVAALRSAGVSVWYDAIVLNWGDDLRPTIDRGLSNCRFGIVILSTAFLGKKKWTEHELNSLFARERAGQRLVLPIWHGITRDDLLEYSPGLADRLAKISSDSYDDIVKSMLDQLGTPAPAAGVVASQTGPDRRFQAREAEQTQRAPVLQRYAGRSSATEDLNPREIELLWNGAKDPEGQILHDKMLSGEAMRANERQFLDGVDARTAAEWLGALRRLEDRGYIEPLSSDRDFFQVTDRGYEAADRLDGFVRWQTEAVVLRAHYLKAPSQEQTISCRGIIAIPARYFDDQAGADGALVRSMKEPRSLLVEGIDRMALPGWDPTDAEFKDTATGRVEQFPVGGMQMVSPARLKLSIVE